jgi:fatty acid desaturase
LLASKDELRAKSVATWRRVQIAGAVAAFAMFATLFLPPLIWLLAPFWMMGGLFAGGALTMTSMYKANGRNPPFGPPYSPEWLTSQMNRMIIREEIR